MNKTNYLFSTLLVLLTIVPNVLAQVPNRGLDRHDFFYAGERRQHKMYKVKDGKVIWEYFDPAGKGEISDAVMMSDGNVLFAHQYGIKEVTADKKTVWSMDTPEGYEIHSIRPIGKNHVVYVQCGKPMTAVVMEIPGKKIVRQFELPYKNSNSHGQNRSICLTKSGTLLVASMDTKTVYEFDSNGKQLNAWQVPSAWGVDELKNGNILVTANNGTVRELNRQGEVVWSYTWKPDERHPKINSQKAYRLKNGNTLMGNWWNEWSKEVDRNNPPTQYIEVTPEGEVVWELCSWNEPADLGPSTTIQPLDEPVNRNEMRFGEFNERKPKLFVGPNEPLGEGIGVHPGRVAWMHAPGVATWDGETGLWVEERWNDQAKADALVREAVLTLAGEENAKKAWKALFTNFNRTRDRGNRGYKRGETIAIKLNMNNAITHRDTIDLNSSPYVTLALLRSLVNDAGVRQEDIIVCEPSRAITDGIYDRCHKEFPRIRFIDNIGGEGREKCEYYPDQIKYSADNGKMARGLAKCIVDADYLINSALLKTHKGPGVTLTAKNWYGATDIALQWRKNAHNNFSADKRHGKPGYKTFVDFMGHKDLGRKCLLFLIDGTYGSRDVNGKPSPKWQKAPFNNDWACSLIVSQDGAACDAVAMDLLMGEWPDFGSFNYCDEYLREATTIPNSVSGTTYDPEQDGTPLNKPLGLMEHWNNARERKYTKLDMVYKQIK